MLCLCHNLWKITSLDVEDSKGLKHCALSIKRGQSPNFGQQRRLSIWRPKFLDGIHMAIVSSKYVSGYEWRLPMVVSLFDNQRNM